jgi:hypothetical protein
MPIRDALRALLFNQGARGAGSQQRRSPAGDVVQWRFFQKPELFSDLQLFGAHFGRVELFAPGATAELNDLICGRVHAFSQRHGALVFHGGEPRHNQICEALPADCNLPQDRAVAVCASDGRFRRAGSAEGALVDPVSPQLLSIGAGRA